MHKVWVSVNGTLNDKEHLYHSKGLEVWQVSVNFEEDGEIQMAKSLNKEQEIRLEMLARSGYQIS